MTQCVAKQIVWVCDGDCAKKPKVNSLRDYRCCMKVRELNCGSSLVVRYVGKHCCTVSTGLNDSACIKKSVIKGKNLVERAGNAYGHDKVKVVESIPDELCGDDIFILQNRLSNPSQKVQKIVNDGRSYKIELTKSDIMANLFVGTAPVKVYLCKCKGSMICVNAECPFHKRFSVVHQIRPSDDKNEGRCTSCDSLLQKLPCNVKKYVALQNVILVEKEGNPILIKYENGLHACLAR